MREFCEFMFQDCTSIVGGHGTTYDPNVVNYKMASIDADGNPGYMTGADISESGDLNYSYDVIIKNGNIPYRGQESIFEAPWDSDTLPEGGHLTTKEDS